MTRACCETFRLFRRQELPQHPSSKHTFIGQAPIRWAHCMRCHWDWRARRLKLLLGASGKQALPGVSPCLGQVERTLRACHYRGPRPGLGGSHKQCSAGVVNGRILSTTKLIPLYAGLESQHWCAALGVQSFAGPPPRSVGCFR